MTAVAELLARAVSAEGVRFEAFDGSSAGPADAQIAIRLHTQEGLRRIVAAPGALGLARAFIAGDLGLDGDLYRALQALAGTQIAGLGWRERALLLRVAGIRALRPPAPPAQEVRRLTGWRHSKQRDAAAISHHYDVSNAFYELVLGPSMAYTCAVYEHPDATLEEAQAAKHDLVARKLGLRPGMRLLDVGCGWGGMVRHAAKHYGVSALGVTLSGHQAEWAAKRIADDGLTGLAEVRHADYRDVAEGDFDAISSIGLTEHIGERQLPAYFGALYRRLKPAGRLLNHCIMRPRDEAPARERRGFINRYVFPDGELEGLGTIVRAAQSAGFEVRHEENLREHYARTCAAWAANLERRWDDAVADVGEATAKVWALYLTGSRLGFERNDIQLHQVLLVRLGPGGSSGMPLRPDWGA
jgi:cyclopropane-fatty-acyl-phospholipid synthase